MSIWSPTHYLCSVGSPAYEMYAVPDNGNTETYVMRGTETHSHLPSPAFENTEAMTNEGVAEYVVDPSMYYHAASGYGYYCTGLESPNEWDVHHGTYGVHGTDAHYAGVQNENMPYIYYTPGYEFGDSAFNPYNPYIPGGMIGADGSSGGTIAYYISPYPDFDYIDILQAGPNTVASSSMDTISDVGPSTIHGMNQSSGRRALPSMQPTFSMGPSKAASSNANIVSGAAEGSNVKAGTTNRLMHSRSNGSGASVRGASHISPTVNTPGSLKPAGKFLPQTNHLNSSYPTDDGLLNNVSYANGQAALTDTWSKYYYRRALTDLNGNHDPLSEQNRGPRTNKSKNQLTVKAYTTKAGERNAEGYIVISADQYNKGDFPVDYINGRFFVIKSYSEDDVHKSIKYSVWSSTPNGNKKLNNAYEDAQKIAVGKPRGCPIFLFFSVNASGQFCGVAEMIGPVDFGNDMDFWQQDKWSGSFPVKWHIIKDVPNPTFRHIILENNEHKPVSNSRDTQEILLKPGLEMLKVFKNYSAKTSLLDDFMYYEDRQRIMHEERAHFHRRASAHVRSLHPQLKLNSLVDRSQKDVEMSAWVEKGAQPQSNKPIGLEKAGETDIEKMSSAGVVDKSGATGTKQSPSELKPFDAMSTLNIGSLTIHPKQVERNPAVPAAMSETAAAPADVVKVAFDGVNRSSGMLTIGTIALDPKSLLRRMDGASKIGLEK